MLYSVVAACQDRLDVDAQKSLDCIYTYSKYLSIQKHCFAENCPSGWCLLKL